jgi:hypothetical protein
MDVGSLFCYVPFMSEDRIPASHAPGEFLETGASASSLDPIGRTPASHAPGEAHASPNSLGPVDSERVAVSHAPGAL